MGKAVLYLDFDGVLHPDAVFLVRRKVELRAEGELFMWSERLIDALKPHSAIDIVLSTSWVRSIGFDAAKKALPQNLRERVIGATWHSMMGAGWPDKALWQVRSRYHQIAADLSRRKIEDWLAIDDDTAGWPECHRGNLIETNPQLGLGDDAAISELEKKLARLASA